MSPADILTPPFVGNNQTELQWLGKRNSKIGSVGKAEKNPHRQH